MPAAVIRRRSCEVPRDSVTDTGGWVEESTAFTVGILNSVSTYMPDRIGLLDDRDMSALRLPVSIVILLNELP
jgi:hypothetical protein